MLVSAMRMFVVGVRMRWAFTLLVLFLAAAARIVSTSCGLALGQKLFPAMLAAKVKCLSVAFGAESRSFVHRHSANWVFGHDFAFRPFNRFGIVSDVFIHTGKRTSPESITLYFTITSAGCRQRLFSIGDGG